MNNNETIIITGASGLLGRKVYQVIKSEGKFKNIIGLAFSRAEDDLIKIDLTNTEQVKQLFDTYKPNVVIHCAAERFPDKVESNPEETIKLNVQATKELGLLCKQYNTRLIYISSDYVFDGVKPPYSPNDLPNPLNFYGKTKHEGEKELISIDFDLVILRVPVLYGETKYLKESAINCLIESVKSSDKQIKMDHLMPRYPTYVGDIAKLCKNLSDRNRFPNLPNILHFSNTKVHSKYEICVIFAKLLNVNMDHIIPVTEKVNDGVLRPDNVHLDITLTKELGLIDFEFTDIENYFKTYFENQN
ncbi:NAD-P-binding protein [Neoconidiobolus thromboides FSU 785]|nr:NAD-P-binding protein [Neoconidiobolus thromboides FSU 785]